MGKAAKKNNVFQIPSMDTTIQILSLVKSIDDLKKENNHICEMAARSILHALDLKDHYTFGHSMRVAYYALTTGRELGFNEKELYDLEMTGIFHDVGKIGIPDKVLLKPSRLSEREFRIMKLHPEKSAEILEGFTVFDDVAKYARHHHERYDGYGYPDRLKGEDIPIYSRIILIADTFDAMTSSRPYREGLAHEIAFDELLRFSGTQFDATLVENFIRGMKKEENKHEDSFYLNIMQSAYEKKAA